MQLHCLHASTPVSDASVVSEMAGGLGQGLVLRSSSVAASRVLCKVQTAPDVSIEEVSHYEWPVGGDSSRPDA
jgi:hypothetical protein